MCSSDLVSQKIVDETGQKAAVLCASIDKEKYLYDLCTKQVRVPNSGVVEIGNLYIVTSRKESV